jgi:hypothetical protein
MNKLQRQRLDKLIAHLEEVERRDPDSFDLSDWIQAESPDDLVKAIRTWRRRWKKGETLNCGTAACVAGHLPLVFPRKFKWRITQFCGADSHTGDVVSNDAPWGIDQEDLAEYFGGISWQWKSIIRGANYSEKEKDAEGRVRLRVVIERITKLRDTRETIFSCITH